MYNPLEQFTITPLIRIYNDWIDLTITNSTIMLLISVFTILLITNFSKNSGNNLIIANKWERFIELTYKAVQDIVVTMLPGKSNEKYIPLIINIFLFILLNNLIGLIPYSFTTTSHMAITLTLSLSIIIGVTFIGFKKHSIGFFKLFIPSGLNKGFIKILIPLIFVIELISYLTRIISLSVRLTANMMSGHTLLKIIANFGLLYSSGIFVLIPLLILIPVVILELGVAIIQAYVFTMLTASYIKDAELLH
jgi:ATP synthase subunit 6